MKRAVYKISSVLLSFCMIVSSLVGISVTAGAEDITEWYVGALIDLSGKWFYINDDDDNDELRVLGGTGASTLSLTSAEPPEYITSSVNISKEYDGSEERDPFYEQTNIYITPSAPKTIAPIGIKVISGTGDKDDAYRFDLIYPDEYTSGGCTVFYDKVTHTVTVQKSGNGNGVMNDYADYDSVPWSSVIGDVQRINIQEGVSYVGDFAFYGNSGTAINISSSVTHIGDSSFCSSAGQICTVCFTRPDTEQNLEIKGIPFNPGTVSYDGSGRFVLFDGETDVEDGAPSSVFSSDTAKTFNWSSAPFDITIAETEHGKVAAVVGENNVTKAQEGREVTLKAAPDTNYILVSLTVTSPRESITELRDLVSVMGDKVYTANADYFDDFDDYYCKTLDGKFAVYDESDRIIAELSAGNLAEFNYQGKEICVDTKDNYEWWFQIKDQKINKITVYKVETNKDVTVFRSVTGLSTGSIAPDVLTLTAAAEGSEYKFTMPGKTVAVTAEFGLHTHSFTYTASGATITAACTEDCPLEGHKATLTINAPANLTYDGTEKPAAITGDTDILGTPEIKYTGGTSVFNAAPASAGTYTASITVGGVTASVEYTIAPKAVTVPGISGGSKVYDGTNNFSDIINCNVGSTDDPIIAIAVEGKFADANVGTGKSVTITGLKSVDSNYVLAESGNQTTLTADITARPITIRANDQTIEVFKSISTGTGFVEITGEGLADEQSLYSIALSDGGSAAIGSANRITPSAAVIKDAQGNDVTANYNITYEQGTLTVTKVKSAVKTAPAAKTLTYNGEEQALVSAGTTTGGPLKYSLDGTNWSTSVPKAANAGSYTVYYKIEETNEVTGTEPVQISVSIARKAVVVTADTIVRQLDTPDPELTAIVTGLVGDDTITYTLTRTPGEEVGAYTITPAGDTVQGNYTVDYQPGRLIIADLYVGDMPVEGTFADTLKNAKGDMVAIMLGKDVSISRLTFPKAKECKEIVIDGCGCAVEFTGSASIRPNQKLTILNAGIIAEKNGKPQNITITASNGGLTLENVSLNGKKATVTASKGDLTLGSVDGTDLTVRGAAKTTLTANGDVAAAVVSGFGTAAVDGILTVTKSLTVNELQFADGAVLEIAGGAAVTVKKSISGNGTIDLASGFKPVSISGKVNGNITLTGDKIAEGTQIFKTRLDLSGKVDISGIAPEVTDGEYEYGLYAKSGKVYLRAFRMKVGDTTYCEWTDIMNSITKAKASDKIYAIELLGNIDLGKAFKLPTKGKYAGLTIDGNDHTITFSGSTITLTGDLTLNNITLNATAKNGSTIKKGMFTFDKGNAALENCTVK